MKNTSALLIALAFAVSFAQPLVAQEESPVRVGPADIVNAAPQDDWVVIKPEEMLVMMLAPDAEGNARRVVIQLMPKPFSQGWVENIKTLAAARWYDGTSINRVQDNYVVQWGDPGHDNPEGEGIEKKPLPDGLKVMSEAEYSVSGQPFKQVHARMVTTARRRAEFEQEIERAKNEAIQATKSGQLTAERAPPVQPPGVVQKDNYSLAATFDQGWPIGVDEDALWPVHCYGMVGVGRNYSPDTGTGAELYTVIGHAPRHLDRNIALVGRIVGGMEHLSSLPRGSGALGFYTKEEAEKRTPILSIRLASELPEAERPLFEYLGTETETFARYAEARANRRDPFFITPAGGADICNISVPVRAFEYAD